MYGITVGLQSLSQLKKRYKDNWESVLDCVDTTLFLRQQFKGNFGIYGGSTSVKKLGTKNQLVGHFRGKVLHLQTGMLLVEN